MLEQLRPRLAEALDLAALGGLIKKAPDGRIVHAPFSLLPCPLPAETNHRLAALTPPFSRLAWAVARQPDFLQTALAEAAATDPFLARLLKLARAGGAAQPLYLQMVRSDYFVEAAAGGEPPPIRQVELNTIAASYLGLTARVNRVHRHLLLDTPWLAAHLPTDPIPATVAGFQLALARYGHPGAAVAMVVQPGENNVFDQRVLEFALAEQGVPVRRVTLAQLGAAGRLKAGHLVLGGDTLAVVYFRAGYGPDDYDQADAWRGRELVESSAAIAVPSVATQLAGTKKIQQLLTDPATLRDFAGQADAAAMEKTFAAIYALEQPLPDGRPAWQTAQAEPHRFVLKPQREGGGHNFYDADLAQKLEALRPAERPAYILMERIRPFAHPAALVLEGALTEVEGVSEIGRFGLLLADGPDLLQNQDLGYLVRTKGSQVQEGGVSAGFGFLNSLLVTPTDPA